MLPPPVSNFAGIVGREPYPVTKKAAEILRRLLIGGVTRLKKLFDGNRTRSEVVATFLALLELSRQKSICLGTDAGGDETVTFLRMPEETEEEG